MKVYYVFDPLCVFCYGFTPMIKRLYEQYKTEIEFELLPGGLWIDEHVKQVNTQVAANLTKASRKVSEMTGRVFGEPFYKFLETNPVLDSMIGSKAMMAVITQEKIEPFSYLSLIYKSTFINGNNPSDTNIYLDTAENLHMDVDAFAKVFMGTDSTTRAAIEKSKTLGATSYPTVLIEDDGELSEYPLNYNEYEPLQNWLLKHIKRKN